MALCCLITDYSKELLKLSYQDMRSTSEHLLDKPWHWMDITAVTSLVFYFSFSAITFCDTDMQASVSFALYVIKEQTDYLFVYQSRRRILTLLKCCLPPYSKAYKQKIICSTENIKETRVVIAYMTAFPFKLWAGKHYRQNNDWEGSSAPTSIRL